MYESHFGLTKKAFSLEPDPQFVMLGEQHGMAMALLEYAITDQSGYTVITGEVGCGKTTLASCLLHQARSRLTIGMINDTVDFGEQLLSRILLTFDQDFEGGSRTLLASRFASFASSRTAQGRRPVLVVDEAQNLGAETLEQLRLLTNIKDDNTQLVQLILLGQPELIEILRRPRLKQFRQRVSIHYHLHPLERMDTWRYIRHRVGVAGGGANLFDDAACDFVHDHSGGVPRLINMLCDMALVYGFGRGAEHIDLQLVELVVRDRLSSELFRPSASTSPLGARAQRSPRGPSAVGETAEGDLRPDDATDMDLESSRWPMALIQDGRHARLNRDYARLFGVGFPERLVGQPAVDLLVPEDRDPLAALLWRCECTGFGRGTLMVRAPDGAGGVQLLELTVRCAALDGQPAASISGRLAAEARVEQPANPGRIARGLP